ncbi:hypothetical protein FACS1894122_03490 [Alphaproteobacteria bacterium]|nr:hypothetical protein FACS1894122_03490 [Alphaproteobacteria bacterium]
MKYVIGIVAVVGFCSTAVALAPVAVAPSACVDQSAMQRSIVDGRLSVTLCDSGVDDGKLDMYLYKDGDYDFVLKSIESDNSSSNPMIVQSRNITPGAKKEIRNVSISLVGLKDTINPVRYEIDVCNKSGVVLGSYLVSDKGISKK